MSTTELVTDTVTDLLTGLELAVLQMQEDIALLLTDRHMSAQDIITCYLRHLSRNIDLRRTDIHGNNLQSVGKLGTPWDHWLTTYPPSLERFTNARNVLEKEKIKAQPKTVAEVKAEEPATSSKSSKRKKAKPVQTFEAPTFEAPTPAPIAVETHVNTSTLTPEPIIIVTPTPEPTKAPVTTLDPAPKSEFAELLAETPKNVSQLGLGDDKWWYCQQFYKKGSRGKRVFYRFTSVDIIKKIGRLEKQTVKKDVQVVKLSDMLDTTIWRHETL